MINTSLKGIATLFFLIFFVDEANAEIVTGLCVLEHRSLGRSASTSDSTTAIVVKHLILQMPLVVPLVEVQWMLLRLVVHPLL